MLAITRMFSGSTMSTLSFPISLLFILNYFFPFSSRVITTLEKLGPERRCFRLVGDVLVERTQPEVLEAVKLNKKQVSLNLHTIHPVSIDLRYDRQIECSFERDWEWTQQNWSMFIKFHYYSLERIWSNQWIKWWFYKVVSLKQNKKTIK